MSRSSRPRLLGAVVALALVLAAAACGDDDDGDDAGSTSSTSSTAPALATTTPDTDDVDHLGCTEEQLVTTGADFFDDGSAGAGEEPSILGLQDVDGDGDDELWAQTGSGASATILGLALVDGCELTRVLFESGDPAAFAVGGSVGSASGLACESNVDDASDITAFDLSTTDGESYEVTAREYDLQGDRLVEVASDAATVGVDDPDFGRYSGFSCGELTYG